jgi:hypothetical protein
MHPQVYAHTRRTAMHGIPAELDGFCVSSTAVGLLAGGLSALLTQAVYAAEDTFARLPLHWMWWRCDTHAARLRQAGVRHVSSCASVS